MVSYHSTYEQNSLFTVEPFLRKYTGVIELRFGTETIQMVSEMIKGIES